MKLADITGHGAYLIAEMSANHAGSLDHALEIVGAAKKAGADCLKIQTYTADTITMDSDRDCFLIKGGLWDGRRLYELYQEASTPWEWHGAIRDECARQGLDFLSTPFGNTAVDFLEELGVAFYKIASFELTDIPLIEYTAGKGKPMLLSCGMGTRREIADALDACRRVGNDQVVLLKCCSEYPANPADMRLATIADMRERFGVPVGLSDHSMGSLAAVVAVSLGACVIEKHFCLSRDIPNPDSAFSMEPQEFAEMARQVRAAMELLGEVSYERTAAEQASVKFRRSLFAVRDIGAGEFFTADNVRSIRPSDGLPPARYPQVLGRRAARDIPRGTPLRDELIAP